MNTTTANDTTADTFQGIRLGETREVASWRLHRFATLLVATDLTHAGKRGKTVRELRLSFSGRKDSLPLESMTMELILLARRGASFDRMAQAFREEAEVHGLDVSTLDCRGVDVEPAGRTLRIESRELSLEASARRFLVRDRRDQNNLPCAMEPADGSIRAAVAFLAWATRHEAEIRDGMTFSALVTSIREAGIEAHQWCSMD